MTRSMLLSRTRLLALAMAAALLAIVALQLVGPRLATTNVHAAVGPPPPIPLHITMKVTGHLGVLFKGEDGALPAAANLIKVLAYQYELNTPFDPATGQLIGRAQHKPVMITHAMGGSSPQFLFAEATNENLKTVVIDFFRPDKLGRDFNYYRVTLSCASVSDVKQVWSGSGTEVLEDVSFVFRRIQQDDFIAKTSVSLALGAC